MARVRRLLQEVVPEHYELDVTVELETARFIVKQKLRFEAVKDLKKIVLHGLGLEHVRGSLEDGTAPIAITADAEAGTLTFAFAEAVAAGTHELELDFDAHLSDRLHGFYRSRYEREGETRYLAVTQFEAIHAREAFVCVDEPAAKAVFEVSLTVEEGLVAISNTAAVREVTLSSGRIRHDFAPTPRMSTYLLAFVVGDLANVSRVTPEGVTVRGYATPDKVEHLSFALDVAVRTMSYYHDYFGQAYPLPKLDMIAIPDFAAGAMENWGAVTYRETALLIDDANASQGNRKRVTEVVAHELAHQWFGNLVTMAWWNDLWLNEGFASWVEVLAQDHLFPEWQAWTQFVSDHVAYALERDGLAATHPIEVEVEDPRALDEIFDAVSYSKGASVINMLAHYLGADHFRAGLQAYLATHRFGNATTADLWAALEAASGKPVARLMRAWTRQPGYPLVRLEAVTVGAETVGVTQCHYLSSGASDTSDGLTWPVPLEITSDLERGPMELVDTATATAAAPLGRWYKPNPGQTGFYRVWYDEASLSKLAPAIAGHTLPAVDRYGVVADVFATARSGHTGSRPALELVARLRGEPNYVVWQAMAAGLSDTGDILVSDDVYARLEAFTCWLVAPNLTRLGWSPRDGESYFDTLMRPLVLTQAVKAGETSAVATARELFDRWLAGHMIPADLRTTAYLAAARSGDEAEYAAILGRYRSEADAQERQRLLIALTRFSGDGQIDHTLHLMFSEDVRAQDAVFVIGGCLQNRAARSAAWRFLQDSWPQWLERFGAGGHMLEYLPTYVGDAFATTERADEVAAFFAAHPHPAIERSVAQAIESIRLKAAWRARDGHAIARLLTDPDAAWNKLS